MRYFANKIPVLDKLDQCDMEADAQRAKMSSLPDLDSAASEFLKFIRVRFGSF